MARIHVDIDELKKFALTLQQVRDSIGGERRALHGRIEDARGYWQDDEYAVFQGQYTKIDLGVTRFECACQRYLDYLERKERALRRARGFG